MFFTLQKNPTVGIRLVGAPLTNKRRSGHKNIRVLADKSQATGPDITESLLP